MPARRLVPVLIALVVVAVGAAVAFPHRVAAARAAAAGTALPEFPSRSAADWLNGPPLTGASLRGRPVLIEFWTFECSNCLATLPWLRTVAARYRDRGLVVIGVHTPELPAEHDREAVRRAVARLGIDYPVLIDEDYRYWNALGNRYWPAFYLYDAQGQRVASRFGEQHLGESGSEAFEARIAATVGAAGTAE
jgi:thiol-disulfide isomerase/thioredoxin